MRKDKLYFLTFTSLTLVFLLLAILGIEYAIKININSLIEEQIETGQREANEISEMLHFQFENGMDREKIIHHTQQVLQRSNRGSSFISVSDMSEKYVCHPDISKIEQKINSDKSLINLFKQGKNLTSLHKLIVDKVEKEKEEADIIYISPLKSLGLVVNSQLDLNRMMMRITILKRRLYITFTIMGFLIILASFFVVRLLGSYYEKQLELKNFDLESELINLSRLNTDLVAYQQRIEKEGKEVIVKFEPETLQEPNKMRLLTFIRNELIATPISKIAYIFTKNTITYVVQEDTTQSTTNNSLDEIFTELPPSLFFRVNRQFIIGITAIDKVIKYGKSQLKLVIKNSDLEIIISKNKAAEFKKWLNI